VGWATVSGETVWGAGGVESGRGVWGQFAANWLVQHVAVYSIYFLRCAEFRFKTVEALACYLLTSVDEPGEFPLGTQSALMELEKLKS